MRLSQWRTVIARSTQDIIRNHTLAFAAALGYEARITDLDAMRRSPTADYLLQTATTERGTGPVTRLFHQALTDELTGLGNRSAFYDALQSALKRVPAGGGLAVLVIDLMRRRSSRGLSISHHVVVISKSA